MSAVEILCLAVGLLGLGWAVLVLRRSHREQEALRRLSERIEHFLLYPDAPLDESLDEGALANLENQFARLERQFLHQRALGREREEQMTCFVENMAHQMNNAVTALQIQLDLLEQRTGPEERTALRKSQACLTRLTGEIGRVLRSSQLAAGKITMRLEPLEIRGELALCMERLAPIAASRRVELRVEQPEEVYLAADGFWLSQALENLLKNALEHTAEDSVVSIKVRDEGRNIRVRIEDEGPGIPPGELPELFLRFHRGSVAKAGYGIGLSMAKDIIEAHHGTLSAGNREGGGAWFEAVLPVLEGARAYTHQSREARSAR